MVVFAFEALAELSIETYYSAYLEDINLNRFKDNVLFKVNGVNASNNFSKTRIEVLFRPIRDFHEVVENRIQTCPVFQNRTKIK